MDILEYIQIGRIIYIEDSTEKSWPFVVAMVSAEGIMVCKAIGRKSTPMQISSDNTVIIVIPNNKLGAYKGEATLLDKDEQIAYLKLQLEGITEHVQRREYFRILKPAAHVAYKFIERGQAEHDVPLADAIIWDLSGNGIGIIACAENPPSIGCKALLSLKLEETNTLEIAGKVVRVIVRSVIKKEYLIGIYFERIKNTDQRSIIHYVTNMQLDNLRAREANK